MGSVMGSRRKTLRWVAVACLVLAFLFALAFSKPVRLEYHKWRLIAAKREHLRLSRGEHRFSDAVREILLAKPVTWADVRAAWAHHEQKLVDLGFLHRKEYYARRGQVPTRADPDFARVIDQMEKACPWWSYSVSASQSGLTVTATKEGLELWKKLAPSIKLREDKPTKEGRRSHKCGRRYRRDRPDAPASAAWPSLFGRAADSIHRPPMANP